MKEKKMIHTSGSTHEFEQLLPKEYEEYYPLVT